MLEAIKVNDVNAVKTALENGFEPNEYKSEFDLYLLEEIFFARFEKTDLYEIVKLLLDHGCNPNLYKHESYFYNVVESSSMETIQLFLENGIDLENEDHGKLFCAAVHAGNIDFIKVMLDKGYDPATYSLDHYSTDANCLQALSYAEQNQIEIIDLLLRVGLDLNAYSDSKKSILTDVITSAPLEVIKYLIDKEAKTDHKTSEEHSLLEASAYYGGAAFEYLAQSAKKEELAQAARLIIERLTVWTKHLIPKMQVLLDLGISFDYL